MDTQIAKLQELIDLSRFTVAITGAGISNSAGIKDMEHMTVM
jgi:NAD-dependent SIR2 family protein deacetylase